MSRFTVVIPTYNRAHMVERAVRSVLRQSFGDWQLLIIDDASTDDTKQVLESYLLHPNVRYHRMETNVGISEVMNQALQLVDTPYLVQLDSDDWLPPHALATLWKGIKKDGEKSALYYGNMNLWRFSRGKYRKIKTVKQRQITGKYDFLRFTGWMVTPRCYRVSALREVGGWDTSDEYGGRIMEDRRIILRLIERYPVRWLNHCLYNRTKHVRQLTHKKTIEKRNVLRRKTFDDCLERWGGKYRAVYGYRPNGYLVIKRLERVKRR